jgi:hypothetical protein
MQLLNPASAQQQKDHKIGLEPIFNVEKQTTTSTGTYYIGMYCNDLLRRRTGAVPGRIVVLVSRMLIVVVRDQYWIPVGLIYLIYIL